MTEFSPQLYMLAMVRVAAFLVFVPLKTRGIAPNVGKAVLAMVITSVIAPFDLIAEPYGLGQSGYFLFYMAAEVLFGAFMGFAVQVFFHVFLMAGQMISQQMGLAMAGISDPLTGTQVRVIGVFCNLLGMLMFLALEGHLVLLRALHESFTLWPPGGFLDAGLAGELTVQSISHSFSLAFQMASPVMVMAFTINLSMALLARLVPQINILIMGFSLRIGAGLIGMLIFLSVMAGFMVGVFDILFEFLFVFMS